MIKLAPLWILATLQLAVAQSPQDCSHMEVWDYSTGMCAPLAMEGMPMRMFMVHGNAFAAGVFNEAPRGKNKFAVPNMLMADLGSSVGANHYLNIDLMLTFEKWTFPASGYPELLQVGEENGNHEPFIDSQHPHSSPLMGLTFSDTIRLGAEKNNLKLFFAPRGEPTEGPVAFMHRATGMQNPDAPLGHHVGQDSTHISSTVAGASLAIARLHFEASTFHGREPEPTKVDLPVATPDSYAGRLIFAIAPQWSVMGSVAYVKNPEGRDADTDHVWRYSLSSYKQISFGNEWTLNNTLIFGVVNNFDGAACLHSLAEEFWLRHGRANIWGRIEALQRTQGELAIPNSEAADESHWADAVTVGYSHQIARFDGAELKLGASLSKYFLPDAFRDAYGGNPVAARLFLQLDGMKMWDL